MIKSIAFGLVCVFSCSSYAATTRVTCAHESPYWGGVLDYFYFTDSDKSAQDCEGYRYTYTNEQLGERFTTRETDMLMSIMGNSELACMNVRRQKGEREFNVYNSQAKLDGPRLEKSSAGKYVLKMTLVGYDGPVTIDVDCMTNYDGPANLVGKKSHQDVLNAIAKQR